jgi:hypothetical protein
MAIQFPPIKDGDLQPQNGDTYLYVITQQEFECKRRNEFEAAQWSQKGVINPTSFGYRGLVEIQKPAPLDANKGNIYSVSDGGIANITFEGIGNTEVEQWSLVIFSDPEWLIMNVDAVDATGPWIRTSEGQIKPVVSTDDLNMDSGNYLINELPEL